MKFDVIIYRCLSYNYKLCFNKSTCPIEQTIQTSRLPDKISPCPGQSERRFVEACLYGIFLIQRKQCGFMCMPCCTYKHTRYMYVLTELTYCNLANKSLHFLINFLSKEYKCIHCYLIKLPENIQIYKFHFGLELPKPFN